LIGGVIVGLTAAKGMALATGKPLLAINHLEGHALTPRLVEDIPFPYLLLLVSGGHTQLIIVEAIGQYRLLGSSMDDAVGEAFDKTAKILGLGYPGGPAVEKLALNGDAKRFPLPRSMVGTPHCDFSFSGLKTAVLRTAQALPQPLQTSDLADLCASFQATVGDILCDRVATALKQFTGKHIVVAGGVAANKYLAQELKALAEKHHLNFCAPPMKLCTDNAAMIAWAALERLGNGDTQNALNAIPQARWPLAQVSI
jgi:N6-L-threonylcarbamoyladenine synthase